MTENKEMIDVEEKQSWENILQTENSVAPLVDIYETNDDFVMIANMPGVKKDDVKLKLENDSLLVFGKINYEEALNRKYVLHENEIANYYRRFNLSDSIDASKINATYENGQLFVTLPKHDRIKPRTINIK